MVQKAVEKEIERNLEEGDVRETPDTSKLDGPEKCWGFPGGEACPNDAIPGEDLCKTCKEREG